MQNEANNNKITSVPQQRPLRLLALLLLIPTLVLIALIAKYYLFAEISVTAPTIQIIKDTHDSLVQFNGDNFYLIVRYPQNENH